MVVTDHQNTRRPVMRDRIIWYMLPSLELLLRLSSRNSTFLRSGSTRLPNYTASCDVRPCNLIHVTVVAEETSLLHLFSRNSTFLRSGSKPNYTASCDVRPYNLIHLMHGTMNVKFDTCYHRNFCSVCPPETVRSFEVVIPDFQTTRRHVTGVLHFKDHRHENVKSHACP